MRKAAEADVHMEADIHALANNRTAFRKARGYRSCRSATRSRSCRAAKRSAATSCRWWRATDRTMATTSSWRARASTGEIHDLSAEREGESAWPALRPPYGSRDRCPAVVQDVRRRMGVHVRRRRQERRVLTMGGRMTGRLARILRTSTWMLAVALAAPGYAAESPTYAITLDSGRISAPLRTAAQHEGEVHAAQYRPRRRRIEGRDVRVEKVLAPGAESFGGVAPAQAGHVSVLRRVPPRRERHAGDRPGGVLLPVT